MSPRRRESAPWDTPAQPAPTTAFERSARFWMQAYPLRWREKFGDELLGVLEDVARGDGRALPDRLPRAEAVGLVKAGWALRWRERPPLWLWVLYRTWSFRLPERYIWWVVDDIRSPWFSAIDSLGRLIGIYTLQIGIWTAMMRANPFAAEPYGSPLFWAFFGLVWVVFAGGFRTMQRRKAWVRHVVDPRRLGVPDVASAPIDGAR